MSREAVLAALDEVIREGDDLFDRTNDAINGGRTLALVDQETVMLGARALNALYAIRLLAAFHVDDQIAIIGRSLIEAAVDVEYLNETTTRRSGNREVELAPAVKADLFATHKPMFVFDVVTQSEGMAPDDPLPDEIARDLPEGFWDGVREERDNALRMRERLGLRPNAYWAGIGNAAMIAELLPTATTEPQIGRLTQLRRLFRDLSFYAHTNPNDAPYVVRDTSALRATFRDDSIIGASIIAALEVLWRWGAVLGDEMRPRFMVLLQRLRSEA